MPADVSRLIAKVHDAGLTPDAWPEALKALTDELGIAGAACIAFDKATGRVDWVRLSGLSAAFESKYINLYAPLDPFSPLLNVEPGWRKLSESCQPQFWREANGTTISYWLAASAISSGLASSRPHPASPSSAFISKSGAASETKPRQFWIS